LEEQVSKATSSAVPSTSPDRFRIFSTNAVVALCAAIIGYLLGLFSGHSDLVAVRAAAQQVQTENQRLKSESFETSARLVQLSTNLTNARAALEAINPTQDTYKILPNQSLIVAEGRLTVGLIGSPTNENVLININGKQQSAAPGDVIRLAPDASTHCQIRIQSFDMFNAVFGASCSGTKP
jgi:hypothetical protein